jgi:hypothetical protein
MNSRYYTKSPRTVLTDKDRRMIDLLLSPPACGTPEGFRGHALAHEAPCGACARAWERTPGTAPVERETCASNRGWMDHRWRMELPCERCVKAREEYERSLCGSYRGWMIHRRSGTQDDCAPCTAAAREYQNRLERSRGASFKMRGQQRAGAVLVCTRPGYRDQFVTYAPRRRSDPYPWRVGSGPFHVSATDVAAVLPDTDGASR